jgi:hypothetical protein
MRWATCPSGSVPIKVSSQFCHWLLARSDRLRERFEGSPRLPINRFLSRLLFAARYFAAVLANDFMNHDFSCQVALVRANPTSIVYRRLSRQSLARPVTFCAPD